MDAIAGYVLRVCCSAVIAGIIQSVCPEGAGGKVRKMIIGIFMAFVVISPLRELELGELWELPEELYDEGQDISAIAQADATDAVSELIIQQLTAYILDEAGSLNADIQVTRVSLDPDTLAPMEIELTGEVSPYARSLLSDSIESNLGIGKEDQTWKT